MTLIDRAAIELAAGAGGSGAMSFLREKFKPKGGPDGGDGGRGGSVYIEASPQLSTLLDYKYKAQWRADSGQPGQGSEKTGRSGEDLCLPVPPGTVVIDTANQHTLGEVLVAGDRLLVAQGGRGGRGNARFATATHQAPREWQPGEPGERRRIELVLKLIADVGLLGQPNAGKSTLLSVISQARPKIANYPFTTLEPHLGVALLSQSRTLVVADIPGIIEGAHTGKGLGDRFLQHVERTGVVAYLIPVDEPDPQGVYDLLRGEARQYGGEIADKHHVVVLTKTDLLPDEGAVPSIEAPEADGVLAISAVAHSGLDELKEVLWRLTNGSEENRSQQDVPLP